VRGFSRGLPIPTLALSAAFLEPAPCNVGSVRRRLGFTVGGLNEPAQLSLAPGADVS